MAYKHGAYGEIGDSKVASTTQADLREGRASWSRSTKKTSMPRGPHARRSRTCVYLWVGASTYSSATWLRANNSRTM